MSQLDIKNYPVTIHYFTEALGDNITMNMVLIPAGSFQMGSPEDELERSDRESPQHTVAKSHKVRHLTHRNFGG